MIYKIKINIKYAYRQTPNLEHFPFFCLFNQQSINILQTFQDQKYYSVLIKADDNDINEIK